MKRLLVGVMSLLLINSCANDDDASQNDLTLVGQWQLVAFYGDPGDGSGDFQPLTSSKTITFEADGSLSSNANLCLVFSDVGEPSAGTYSETDASISIADCSDFNLVFEISATNLIIDYPCIEACREKYVKLE
ncbi:lipocalin family protein [Subsaximicrobium wynnwilliamsii]|jgi:hypothetical protein|uniref:Lipocalin family protein n=1 Tax=Subsaximicrobium wynnwilliamsii TaxID=291179 RepID=A0A5C6ZCS3_9FLAO|nr:lipocalin family protein [Subsaximicrobium wynnwilliamsii]TXD82065.1 lipocalin family protein [Subsaximicrobium wynnwilliamsii]TXD87267.1 lipocalin family protein [Subsaximicrobium wynnwilliamsii]TXE01525.1 lipocalin family protein [Subsaximicrobium wynnwilliamsii]